MHGTHPDTRQLFWGCEMRIERYFSAGSFSPKQVELGEEKLFDDFWLFLIQTNILKKIEFPQRRNNRKWKMISQLIHNLYKLPWYLPENLLLINGVYMFWISNCAFASAAARRFLGKSMGSVEKVFDINCCHHAGGCFPADFSKLLTVDFSSARAAMITATLTIT